MKRVLIVVVALAVVAIVYFRSASTEDSTSSPSTTRSSETRTSPMVSARPVIRQGGAPIVAAPASATPVYATPPPAPMDGAARRDLQDKLWQELREFAVEVKLTDAQWDQFVRDLIELGGIDSQAWWNATNATGDSSDFAGLSELNDALEQDLQARCARYMTDKQLRQLRFRLTALVTRARQLLVAQPTGPQPSGS